MPTAKYPYQLRSGTWIQRVYVGKTPFLGRGMDKEVITELRQDGVWFELPKAMVIKNENFVDETDHAVVVILVH